MKRTTLHIFLSFAFLLMLTDISCAGEKLSKQEVTSLISGTNYKTSTGNNGTIDADGSLSAQSSSGGRSNGTWSVEDNGDYCNNWDNPRWSGSCAPFYKIDEKPNVYLRDTPSGQAEYTFTKK
ncbi:exported hypothetical protein [Azospirillaceae bacterium]